MQMFFRPPRASRNILFSFFRMGWCALCVGLQAFISLQLEDGRWRQPFPVWLAEAGYYDAVGGKEMQFPNLRIMCKDGTMAGLMPRELK